MKRMHIYSCILGFIASGFATLTNQAFANTQTMPMVIELFTSQGCSSCPAADKLLQELDKKPGIIAMSFPVTYWDHLGWKDTFAKPQYSQRQRDYAGRHGKSQIYTPQAVINGVSEGIGSSRSDIDAALKNSRPVIKKAAVSMSVKRQGETFIIDTGGAPAGSNIRSGKVWFVALTKSAAVKIERGENAGRKITYTNVVRKLVEAGAWQGAPTAYSIPASALVEDGDSVVVFLQADDLGPIVGAAQLGG